jgi:hypothetical protein
MEPSVNRVLQKVNAAALRAEGIVPALPGARAVARPPDKTDTAR